MDDLLWCGDAVIWTVACSPPNGDSPSDHWIREASVLRSEDKEEYIDAPCPENIAKVKPIKFETNNMPIALLRSGATACGNGELWMTNARLCRANCHDQRRSISKKPTSYILPVAQKTCENRIRFYKKKFNYDDAGLLLSVADTSLERRFRSAKPAKSQDTVQKEVAFFYWRIRVIEWQSHTIKRVRWSTVQAEVLSSIKGSAGQGERSLM